MDLLQAIILGVVEGLTEFLPVSSTGHLTIVEKMMGFSIDDETVTAFTVVIQMGAILAVVLFFWRDIWKIVRAWFRGIGDASVRGSLDYRMGWYVIVGTIPVVIVGVAGDSVITGPLRNLWWVTAGLIGWSVVMVLAERMGRQNRGEQRVSMRDAIVIGVVQCISLIPGVSRSGATISAGLFLGLDRVTATRMSFLLSIPALVGAGLKELPSAVTGDIPIGYTLLATGVSFVVAYAAVAWLLKFVAGHPITWFVPYRLGLALVLAVLLATGAVSPT